MRNVTKFILLWMVIFSGCSVFPDDEQPSQFWPFNQNKKNKLAITTVSDNRATYPSDEVPTFEKFEITFDIENLSAQNKQIPFDPNLPNGLDPSNPDHQGVSVDALFTPDNWQTVYQQPAFYYQHFDDQIKEDSDGQMREWFYPTNTFAWKVRFAPDVAGTWQYKLVAEDAGGYTETDPISFKVTASNQHGFIAVSKSDPRYFEFDSGEVFFPLGFNRGPNLEDPMLANAKAYQMYQENGINLLRVWISEVYGSAWLEWLGGRNIYDGYLPRTGLLPFYDPVHDQFTMSQRVDYEPEGDSGWFDACRFQFWDNPEAVKPNTDYRLRIKYWGQGISGPRDPAYLEYGLDGKIGGGWNNNCYESDSSIVITNYGQNTNDWAQLEGTWNSAGNNFLPRIYIGLENVIEGQAFIQSISLQEDFGNGQFGPEILMEPSMQYELYIPEQSAYALDKVIALAEQNDLFLKLVIHDKDDKIYTKFNDDGTFVYEQEDNQDGFYGDGRIVNKTRWLQQAWWRYLQARWGYSTAIHSWELTNEGDPWNTNHWALADELGKFMHCRAFGIDVGNNDGDICSFDYPNSHLVTTSFWHSLPGEPFWASKDYPNVDYVDVHAYVSTGWLDNPVYENDSASFHLDYSADVRHNINYFTEINGIATKPIIRGEVGIDFINQHDENPDLALDLNGVWLHNLIWSSLDPGAMTELYWYRDNIAAQPGPDGLAGLYEIYSYFQHFMQGIPLNNGNYHKVEVILSDPSLRATGQIDTTNNRAHLWIQNKNHTWRNVVDGDEDLSGLSGIVRINGFTSNTNLDLEWHEFTTEGTPSIVLDFATTGPNGELILTLPTNPDITDVGIKIGD
jgi:hypothetical protein